MIRYLSTIGMSCYVDQKRLDAWLAPLLKKLPPAAQFKLPDREETQLEFCYEMGPFKLVIKAYINEKDAMHVYSVLPVARPGTFSHLLQWQVGWEVTGAYVWGEDAENGGVLEMMLARSGQIARLLKMQKENAVSVAYTGISIEGKVLLGLHKSDEDLAMYAEEEQWRRNMLEKLRSGDKEALRELEEDAQMQEQEIRERMRHEDLFTILEGMFVPADDVTTGLYQAMGTILDVDKVLNPFTEEWVYHLQLDVMGSPLDVYIHPDDLVGIPAVGRRYMGKVRIVGNINLPIPNSKLKPLRDF